MKVRALNTYKELSISDNELNRIPEAGEEFEVSEERAEVLLGNNEYNTVFVEIVSDDSDKADESTTEPENDTENSDEDPEDESTTEPSDEKPEDESTDEPTDEESTDEPSDEESKDESTDEDSTEKKSKKNRK